jgi:hypothetical protein
VAATGCQAAGRSATLGRKVKLSFLVGCIAALLFGCRTTKTFVASAESGSAAWSVPNWYIDDANASGCASNANTGTSASCPSAGVGPLATKSGLYQRWGTWSPILNAVTVTVTYLSGDTGTSDPSLFAPVLSNGAQFIETAPLPAPAFVGTLGTVTAKNRTHNQILQATFNATSGSIAQCMLLVNVTRGNSRSFAQRLVSGATWQLDQPLTPWTPGTVYGTNVAEVDTWQAGDSIDGYNLTAIYEPVFGGQMADFGNQFSNFMPGHAAYQINFQSFNLNGPWLNNWSPIVIDVRSNPELIESAITRSIRVIGAIDEVSSEITTPAFSNVCHAGANFVGSSNTVTFFGGNVNSVRASTGTGVSFAYDTIVSVGQAQQNDFQNVYFGYPGVAVDSVPGSVACGGGSQPCPVLLFTWSLAEVTSPVYGPGELIIGNGIGVYGLGSTASSLFQIANTDAGGGGLLMGYNSYALSPPAPIMNAYAVHTSDGGVTTIRGGVPLTPGNIDLCDGGGFCGLATNLAGAEITNSAQP